MIPPTTQLNQGFRNWLLLCACLLGGLAAAPIKQAEQDQPEAIVRKVELPTPPPDAPRSDINEPRSHQRAPSPKSRGLILAADEGERMMRLWGLPMTIKIDPVNGGSRHLLVGTEDLPPGKSIPVHKHSHCDEVVIVLQGKSTAVVGEQRREVGAGAMLFIPGMATIRLYPLQKIIFNR
jgi:uncharacterized RmlC-like cupin family protein